MSACAPDHSYHTGRFGHHAGESLRPGGRELTRHAAVSAGFGPGKDILDLGCGEGQGTQGLEELGCRVIGLDASLPSLAATVRALPGVPVLAADAGQLPLADASFDGILAECVLSLVDPLAGALAECRRVLRPGGRLAMTDVFSRAPIPENMDTPSCLRGILPRQRLVEEVERAGFTVERWEDHSEMLKAFIGQLIFQSGSSGALWQACDPVSGEGLALALRQRRPGYFLLIARKAGEAG